MGFTLLDERKARDAVEALEKEYSGARYYLSFSTPIDLVAAAIISAQTRDETVNALTPALFKRYRTAREYANADPEELTAMIRRVSFAGAKAKNIIATCRTIDERYGGKVPDKMDALVELPGIGRKTANTILINAYGIVEGIPVDTWVMKLSSRIGLSESGKPEEIERDLMKVVEKRHWHNLAYVMKSHGKKVCQSKVPLCSKCLISRLCPRNGVTRSG